MNRSKIVNRFCFFFKRRDSGVELTQNTFLLGKSVGARIYSFLGTDNFYGDGGAAKHENYLEETVVYKEVKDCYFNFFKYFFIYFLLIFNF